MDNLDHLINTPRKIPPALAKYAPSSKEMYIAYLLLVAIGMAVLCVVTFVFVGSTSPFWVNVRLSSLVLSVLLFSILKIIDWITAKSRVARMETLPFSFVAVVHGSRQLFEGSGNDDESALILSPLDRAYYTNREFLEKASADFLASYQGKDMGLDAAEQLAKQCGCAIHYTYIKSQQLPDGQLVVPAIVPALLDNAHSNEPIVIPPGAYFG